MADDWTAAILGSEPVIRLAVLAGVLGVMVGWELLAPRRALVESRRRRWLANLGIVLVDTAILRLAVPGAAVGLAVLAQQHGWGLLPLLDLPAWAAIALSLLLLDAALYGQHVATHAVPFLWRLHRVHHTDLDIDVTTGLRFHPFEIVLSLVYKGAVVVALGAPPVAVLMFEVLLNAGSLFSHGNVRLPLGLDRLIRLAWVTPDMHRVHHSILRQETDSNYGTCLSLWDRVFGTYRAQPQAGHDGLVIGIEAFRGRTDQGLGALLLQPFRREQVTKPHTGPSPAGQAF
jgi:sterol desaturase/sphingolipid hydroxylase (fatty acid hydroxylase superfamily)